MSDPPNELDDPYVAPRLTSVPETDPVRIVSTEAKHVELVRRARRLAMFVATLLAASGAVQIAFGAISLYVYATERDLTGATFLTSGAALMLMYCFFGALFMFQGVSSLRASGTPAGNGVSLFRGGWRFTTASVSAVTFAFWTFDWFIPLLGVRLSEPPAYRTSALLIAAAAISAMATIGFFCLAIPSRRIVGGLVAAGLPFESMVDDEGRVVVRLPRPGKTRAVGS